jgi:hypothetical protein
MKQIIFLFLAFFALQATAQDRQLLAFKTLSVQGRMHVDVVPGTEFRMETIAHGEGIDLNKLSLTYKGEELVIKYSGGSLKNLQLDLIIHAPALSGIESRQGAIIKVDPKLSMKGTKVYLRAFAGSEIFADVTSDWAEFKIDQGGNIFATGTVGQLECKVTTGGNIYAAKMQCKRASAEIKFGGYIDINTTDALEANVTSGGTIRYKGTGQVIEKISLGGKIEKM